MRCSTIRWAAHDQPPSRAVRDYLAQFGVVAIFITRSGKIAVGHNLSRAAPVVAAWWVSDRAAAEQVLIAIGSNHPSTVEGAARAILAAAGRLGVTLTEHTTVMRRAKAAVGELDTCLAAVNAADMLSFFNREYRVRRLAAHAAGRSFLPYAEAHRRLRMALASAAATGSMPELMHQVFEG
jgi:hypothetical protein